MKLSEQQQVFAINAAKLILYANELVTPVTLGEAYRDQLTQDRYFKLGLSKTKNSQHLNRMAIDLYIFVNGVYSDKLHDYKKLAEFWESLHPKNVAGYSWGWDAGHFEMKF